VGRPVGAAGRTGCTLVTLLVRTYACPRHHVQPFEGDRFAGDFRDIELAGRLAQANERLVDRLQPRSVHFGDLDVRLFFLHVRALIGQVCRHLRQVAIRRRVILQVRVQAAQHLHCTAPFLQQSSLEMIDLFLTQHDVPSFSFPCESSSQTISSRSRGIPSAG
jgi:hypothetical protein